jgi:hypothetical protein
MDLKEVDVVRVKTLKRCIHSIENGLSRKTTLVRVVCKLWHFFAIINSSQAWVFPYISEAFCEYDELVAWNIVLLDGFANDIFRNTVGIDVGYKQKLALPHAC